jgi:hypothetical protein
MAVRFLTVLTAAVMGFLGYGVSLVLFVLALRHLGTVRTPGRGAPAVSAMIRFTAPAMKPFTPAI